jgi:hypothetical protein
MKDLPTISVTPDDSKSILDELHQHYETHSNTPIDAQAASNAIDALQDNHYLSLTQQMYMVESLHACGPELNTNSILETTKNRINIPNTSVTSVINQLFRNTLQEWLLAIDSNEYTLENAFETNPAIPDGLPPSPNQLKIDNSALESLENQTAKLNSEQPLHTQLPNQQPDTLTEQIHLLETYIESHTITWTTIDRHQLDFNSLQSLIESLTIWTIESTTD